MLVKANAIVTDREVNIRPSSFESDREVPHTAVLDRILQGFL